MAARDAPGGHGVSGPRPGSPAYSACGRRSGPVRTV